MATIGDDPQPSMENVVAAMAAKREISIGGIEVCDVAMEVAGGGSYFRTSPIERCYRDVRGAKFHPFTPEQTLLHAGKVALGLPADEM
jgi:alkylation response protein AidB-like acyl-CoA dehydrogenase